MTSKDEIRGWLHKAKEMKSTHMIVVCDTFDYGDYPVFVAEGENVKEVESKYDDKDMQQVVEVYSLKLDIETQLNERRSFHYD